MKTKLIFILFLYLITSFAYSAKINHRIGAKVGGTYSKLDVNDYYYNHPELSPSQSFYWGTYFGLYDQIKLTESVSVIFELAYNQKGIDIKDTALSVNPHYKKVTIANFELVTILNFKFKSFYLNLGAFLDIPLYLKQDYEHKSDNPLSDVHYKETTYDKYDENRLRYDLGLLIGVGYSYKQFLVELRFNKGFSTLVDYNYDLEPELTKYYDNSYQYLITLGYQFF